MMRNPIHIALSPNNTWEDTLEALKQLCLPWKWASWQKGDATKVLEKEFRNYFGVEHVYAMNGGREALYLILKSLNLKEGDEVLLQSFTCMVVTNSIVWNGLKPVYVDMDPETYNLDPKKLEEKITPRTRAVMVQHTFGIPAELKKIKEICQKHNLILIEDCAHAMGAMYENQKLGTIGDIAFFSLGRSKVVSCVSGGMIVANSEKYGELIKKNVQQLKPPKRSTIRKNLLHPIVMTLVKKLYNLGPFGKGVLVAMQKLKCLTMEVEAHEKKGIFKKPYPHRMPSALAALALIQFAKLDEFNAHRRALAKIYYAALKNKEDISALDPDKCPGAIFLRYPLQCSDKETRDKLLAKAKKRKIILGDWYVSPIAPPNIDIEKTFYKKGSCPEVEKVSSRIINLPTYHSITKKDALAILALF